MNNHNINHKDCGIRVITYNVLTPVYSNPKYYPGVKPDYLDNTFRWNRLLKLLQSWTGAGFIICLQEVCQTWNAALKIFFEQNNYSFYGSCYGKDNMFGQGIALNNKAFRLLNLKDIILGEYLQEHRIKIPANSPVRQSDLDEAFDQENKILCTYIQCKNKKHPNVFVVANYHMPCKYRIPYIMHMHVLGIRLLLNRIYNDPDCSVKSIILAGDMNIQPQSQLYRAFYHDYTQADKQADTEPQDNQELAAMTDLIKMNGFTGFLLPIKSVFRCLDQPEPVYTNVSIQKNNTFIGTLDYIMVSQDIRCKSCVVGLDVPDPLVSQYPNGLSPSDHLPVSASLFV